ncbi:MAG: tryptophan 2,3-dioxygenase family protein [Actinomycetota bacterium]|nr:tryptophan 2,3-dioxygenase family protein [Actinomycetota bacterium]
MPRRPPRFGEEDRQLSYGSYLRIPELLKLQRLQSDPPAHDELLFIVVHQVYELWFKQVLFELESIRDLMFAGRPGGARHLLERVMTIEEVAITQIRVLETMAPQDFLEFRQHLAPASGFQSVQFREIEFVSGLKDARYLDRVSESPGERARLEKRLAEPTLWDAYRTMLDDRSLPMPPDDLEARRATLLKIARDRETYAAEYYVAEALLEHDQRFATWRSRHVLMVERQIGTKSGTGGSTGAPYLRSTLNKRFYPELWDLRSYL